MFIISLYGDFFVDCEILKAWVISWVAFVFFMEPGMAFYTGQVPHKRLLSRVGNWTEEYSMLIDEPEKGS